MNQGERLAKMETKMENIEKGMIKNDRDHEKLFGKLDKFITSADKKYADKSVEERVGKIERHFWKFAGGFITVITLVNWAVIFYATR